MFYCNTNPSCTKGKYLEYVIILTCGSVSLLKRSRIFISTYIQSLIGIIDKSSIFLPLFTHQISVTAVYVVEFQVRNLLPWLAEVNFGCVSLLQPKFPGVFESNVLISNSYNFLMTNVMQRYWNKLLRL